MHFLKIHFLRCINAVGCVKKRHAPRCIHKMQAILSVDPYKKERGNIPNWSVPQYESRFNRNRLTSLDLKAKVVRLEDEWQADESKSTSCPPNIRKKRRIRTRAEHSRLKVAPLMWTMLRLIKYFT